MNRDNLNTLARQKAVQHLEERRPIHGYWGSTCKACGDEIPARPVHGPACSCEREEANTFFQTFIEEHRAEVVRTEWENSGVPPRHINSRFETFVPRDGTEVSLSRCQQWAKQFHREESDRGLLLVGPWGSGKTHLAVSAAYQALARTLVRVRFTSVPSVIHEVKGGENLDTAPIRQAVRAELLVLDDLGQAGRTEFDRELLYTVISERYDNGRPMLVTSNLGPDRISSQLGGALGSRLREMVEPLALTASDYRKKRQAGEERDGPEVGR